MKRTAPSTSSLAFCLFLLSASSGCATLGFQSDGDQLATPAQQPPVATFYVEVREEGKEPRVKQLPLQEPMVVQDVLEKTGVLGEFRKMDIVLERPVPGRWEPLRLDVTYKRPTRTVASQMNYALRPGDRLIVTEDPTTMIEEMVEGAVNSLGPLRGNLR